jgi:hypothetical protein
MQISMHGSHYKKLSSLYLTLSSNIVQSYLYVAMSNIDSEVELPGQVDKVELASVATKKYLLQ